MDPNHCNKDTSKRQFVFSDLMQNMRFFLKPVRVQQQS